MKIVNKRPKLAPQLAAFSDDTPEQQPDVMSAEAENEAEEAVRALKATGQAHAEKGEWSLALSSWDRALTHSTRAAHELYELRAQVLMQVGRDFDAIQSASKATSLAPHFAAGFLTLGRAQLNYGEPKLALRSLQRVLQLQPDHEEAASELGTVQMLSMQQDRAGPGRRAVVQEQDPLAVDNEALP